jgi:hypothetical protein
VAPPVGEIMHTQSKQRRVLSISRRSVYGLPHGILHVFNTIIYENEFQNPQIFQQTISLFPEQSTLGFLFLI